MPNDTNVRIGDVTQNVTDAERIERAVNAVVKEVETRNAELRSGILTDVDAKVKSLLDAERTAKLPQGDPKRRAIDCECEVYKAMHDGNPGVMADIVKRYPEFYPGMTETELKVRATMTTASTGMSYVLPVPTADEIQVYARELYPMLAACRENIVGIGNGIAGSIPVGSSTRAAAHITSQGSAPTDTATEPGTFTYSLLKVAVGQPYSSQLFAYSVPGFAKWANEEGAYALLYKMGTQLATGSNSTQWMGLESAGITAVETGATDAENVVYTFLAVPEMHRVRGVWTCNDTTLAYIHMLKDTTGRWLVPFDEVKNTLYGKPIYPNSGLTSGLLFFGDPSRYIISKGRYMTAQIGPGNGYTATSTDITYLYLGLDCDGGVSDTNAFRYCTLAGI